MRPLFEPSLRQTPPSASTNCPPDGACRPFSCHKPRLAGSWAFTPSPACGRGRGVRGWPVQTKRAHIQDFQQQRVLPRPRGHGYIPLPNPLPQAGEGVKPAPIRPLFEPSLRRKPPSASTNCALDGPCRPFSCHKPRLAGSWAFFNQCAGWVMARLR